MNGSDFHSISLLRAPQAEALAMAGDGAGGIVMPCQTHTCNVAEVTELNADSAFPDIDALVTFTPGLWIGVRTADCVPVVLNAPDVAGVAAVHAGWRGSLGGIVARAAALLINKGADPRSMIAAMGPCICGDCYEVSHELADQFACAGFADCVLRREGEERPRLDLPAVNRSLLLSCGLCPGHIQGPSVCTLTDPRWPSWRRTPGTKQRLVTAIRILP